MKKLTTVMLGVALLCFVLGLAKAQAQVYSGVVSTSLKHAYEDYDSHANLIFYQQSVPVSGKIYYAPANASCTFRFDLSDDSTICIASGAFIGTSFLKTRIKNSYKERFQAIGYGYRTGPEIDDEVVIMTAIGTSTEDVNDDVLSFFMSGTLSGGIPWGGGDLDYLWTAPFISTLTPE
jgi:hypothetical protein